MLQASARTVLFLLNCTLENRWLTKCRIARADGFFKNNLNMLGLSTVSLPEYGRANPKYTEIFQWKLPLKNRRFIKFMVSVDVNLPKMHRF